MRVAPAWPQSEAATARRIVREATSAVEADSVRPVRARWEQQLAKSGERAAILGLATLDRLTYNYPGADRRYRALLPGSAEPADPIGVHAALGMGQGHLTRAQLGPASDVLGRALRASERLRLPAATMEALLGLSRIAARSLGADSAMRLAEQARTVIPTGEPALHAQARCALAALLRGRAGRRADSLATEALRLARRAGDRRTTARCLVVRGQVAEGDGRIVEAHGYLVDANRVATAVRDDETYAVAMQWLAYLAATYLGDLGYARQTALQAIRAGIRVGSPPVVAFAQLNLGGIALRLGDPSAALRAVRDAEQAFRNGNDRVGIANSKVLAGDAEYLAGRLDNARRVYLEADSLFASLGVNARPGLYFKLAAVSREDGGLAEAERYLAEGVRLARASRIVGLTDTDQHYYQGMLALSRGEWAAARDAFATFTRAAGPRAYHYHLDAGLRIAESYAREGRLDDALAMYDKGTLGLDSLRLVLNTRRDALSALQGRRFDFDTDLGIATTINAFARAARVGDALMVAEQERARFLWIALERRRVVSGDSVPSTGVRLNRLAPAPLDLTALQQGLPPDAALLEYVTGRGHEPTTVFVVWAAGARAFTLPEAEALADPVARFRSVLEGGAATPGLARELGRTLLDSAVAVLPAAVTQLVIAPDGVLHRVPFDALRLADGKLVVERFSVSLAPSGRLAIRVPETRVTRRLPGVLAFGNPTLGGADAPAPLPGAAEEARSVARIAGGGAGLTRIGARATEAELSRLAGRAPAILHLATHAEVEDAGLLSSAIRLGSGEGADGMLREDEIARLALGGVSLVVLSGCRTSGGVILTGEGIQGLTAPFLEAGVGAVVATHWAIGDRSTTRLMRRFYEGMKRGLQISAALRQAKLDAITAGESPVTWAAFTLTGDGSARPLGPRR
jgi:tetratricopeptide (TPR) repeat protein